MHFVRNFYGVLVNKDINVKVCVEEFLKYSYFICLIFAACQTAVHKKCHEKLLGKCPESGINSESTIVSIIQTKETG